MPNLGKMIHDGADLTRQAYLIAAYRHYLKYKVDDHGTAYEVNDPWMTAEDARLIASDEPLDFLSLSAFQAVNLKASEAFTSLYLKMVEAIKQQGAMRTLESILS